MNNELIPKAQITAPILIETVMSEARRRRLAMGILFAVIALLALAIGVMWPKKFVSSTTILAQENNIIKPLTEGLTSPTEVADRAAMASEVIFSRKVMDQILTDGGWMANHPSPVEQVRLINEIKGRTSVDTPRPNLIEITYSDTHPERSYKIAREMAALFIQESLQSKENESRSAYEFMDSQVKEYRKKLDLAGDQLNAYRDAHPDAGPGSLTDSNTNITQLRGDMEKARMDIAELGSKSSTLGGQLSGESEVNAVQTREGIYMAQIAELQAQLEKLRLTYTDTYPDVVRTRHQIDDLRQQLAQVEQQKQGAKAAGTPSPLDGNVQVNPVYQQLRTQRAGVRGDLAAAYARLNASSSQLQTEMQRNKRIGDSGNQLSQLLNDYDVNRDIYQSLLKRRESARVAMDMDQEHRGLSFRIQDPAQLPLMPAGLRLMHFAAAGIVAAVLVPLLLLFGLARFDPRIRSSELLERGTGLPVLAAVPYYQTRRDNRRERNRNILAALIVLGVFAVYVGVYLIRLTRAV